MQPATCCGLYLKIVLARSSMFVGVVLHLATWLSTAKGDTASIFGAVIITTLQLFVLESSFFLSPFLGGLFV
jgi:hypothetical protein